MAKHDDRLDDEIQFHIEQQTAKNIRAGMSPDEARRAALLKFGGVEQTREATRDEFRGAMLRDFVRDVHIGFRTLQRVPSFAVTTVLTLALGIGASVAMFSVVYGVLLKPLPYAEPDRIVRLFQVGKTGARNNNVSGPNYDDWVAGTRSFKSTAQMARYGRVPVTGRGEPILVTLAGVSSAFFDVMAVRPSVGRGFRPEEFAPDAPPVVLMSTALWHTLMNDAPLAGQVLNIGGEVRTVVGLMPAGFAYPAETALWAPIPRPTSPESRTAHNYQAIARLADGVSLSAANAEISQLSRQLKQRYGDGTSMSDAAAVTLLDVTTGNSTLALKMLFGASVLLLIVACTNVSNMLVVRASSRRREFAVQLAIGATTGRITRQLLAETLALCAVGAAVGMLMAFFAVRVFAAMGAAGAPRMDAVAVNWPSVFFAFVVVLLAATALGLATAFATRSVRISEALADNSRSGSAGVRQIRARQMLIVTQVALTLVLLTGAALLARSFANVISINTGFRTDNALVVDMEMAYTRDEALTARRVSRQQEIVSRLTTLPGVTHVGLINDFPIGRGSFRNGMFVEMTRPDEFTAWDQIRALGDAIKPRQGYAEYRLVSGGYFAAMGIKLVKGRYIQETDGPGAPEVCVVSASLAEAQWPNQDPIGRYLQMGNMDGDMQGMRVVGVVADIREATPEAPTRATLYASYSQRPRQASGFAIIVRGPAPESISDTVRRVIHEVDPDTPVELRTVTKAIDEAMGSRRFNLWLISAFSLTALMLTTLGVYGLVAYSVAQRTREMGIRMALGATPRGLAAMVVAQGGRLALVGATIGLFAALALTSVIKTMLFNVEATDPQVLGSVLVLTLAAALVASYVPARKILKQTPGRTLRDI